MIPVAIPEGRLKTQGNKGIDAKPAPVPLIENQLKFSGQVNRSEEKETPERVQALPGSNTFKTRDSFRQSGRRNWRPDCRKQLSMMRRLVAELFAHGNEEEECHAIG
ncbi:hypothetical protein [Mameliella alba]|uniref:hypothetical protein n=1 Tax=Mameliella alba TaxID=561184 RepID=UPI00142F88E9|nr:hypothetical protein [Mameliella alba]